MSANNGGLVRASLLVPVVQSCQAAHQPAQWRPFRFLALLSLPTIEP